MNPIRYLVTHTAKCSVVLSDLSSALAKPPLPHLDLPAVAMVASNRHVLRVPAHSPVCPPLSDVDVLRPSELGPAGYLSSALPLPTGSPQVFFPLTPSQHSIYRGLAN